VDRDPARSALASFERSSRPLALGPVVEVDTTRPVDIGALAVRVRPLLPVLGPAVGSARGQGGAGADGRAPHIS
jgi:hypothetical protein